MKISIKIDKKKKTISIVMPLEKPRPSASGKTLLLANTRGLKTGEAVYEGRPVIAVASAFVYPKNKRAPIKCPRKNPINVLPFDQLDGDFA